MKVILIGATGIIGQAVSQALTGQHEVIPVSRSKGEYPVDLTDKASVQTLFERVAPFDAIICAAGAAKFAPLANLSDDDFQFSLANKLMGQVNVVRVGMDFIGDRGSFTLTSGVLAQQPMPGSAAISLVNAGLEGFVRAAALELPRGIRVNVVSPPWVSETLTAMGQDPSGGMPATQVAQAYVASLDSDCTGEVIAAQAFAVK